MIPDPLVLSQGIVQLAGIHLTVVGQHCVPTGVPTIIVSNHRSPLDAPVVMAGLGRTIAFACHPYMSHVPVLKDMVTQFGAFPIKSPRQFLSQGSQHLRQYQTIGIFPEGAKPMVTIQPPRFMNPFHRGFAHLALRIPIRPLAILPVAIVSDEASIESPIPLRLLAWFDPSEPLFQKNGGHPIVLYRSVELRIGSPMWMTSGDRDLHQETAASCKAQHLTDACWTTVHDLLRG